MRNADLQKEGATTEGGYLVPTDDRVQELAHDPGVRGGKMRMISSVRFTTRDAGYIPIGGTKTWAIIAEAGGARKDDPGLR